MKRAIEIAGAVFFMAAGAGLLMAGTNPEVGAWKLNLAESKYTNEAAPKSATRTVEAQGDGVSVSCEVVDSGGGAIKYAYSSGFDEKDSPITGSGTNWRESLVANAETISLRRQGGSSFAEVLKKSGNVVMTIRVVVSKGGKVTTLISNGVDAKGQPTKSVTVWDKQ